MALSMWSEVNTVYSHWVMVQPDLIISSVLTNSTSTKRRQKTNFLVRRWRKYDSISYDEP